MAFLRSSAPEVHGPSEGLCYLYVLPCAYEDLLKLGFSRSPLQRMQSLHPRFFEFFDLDRAVLVETETVRDARRLELELGHRLAAHGAPSPLTVRREAAGHTEWYRGAYTQLNAEAARLRESGYTVHAPSRTWLRGELARSTDVLFDWGAAVLDAVQGEPAQLDTPALATLRRRVLDRLDAFEALDIPVIDHVPPALAQWYSARAP